MAPRRVCRTRCAVRACFQAASIRATNSDLATSPTCPTRKHVTHPPSVTIRGALHTAQQHARPSHSGTRGRYSLCGTSTICNPRAVTSNG